MTFISSYTSAYQERKLTEKEISAIMRESSELKKRNLELKHLSKIVDSLQYAFDDGLRITDYRGGQEIHINLNDIEELLDWYKEENSENKYR